jgi:G6PDH family F420-dependent oxidoreductase
MNGENREQRIGYVLSSEEHGGPDLVRNAIRAEDAGFQALLISDHFHPWTDTQGHSPFVWSVIGALSQITRNIEVVTGVTCPTMRTHPAIIAHAAATAATLLPGRFSLGVGSGENLNEHVVGEGWPSPDTRREMLEEAIRVIKQLWRGGFQNYNGDFYTVEDARIYDLPDELPPLLVGASSMRATQLAGGLADGLIATKPDAEQIDVFREAGGKGKRTYGKLIVCWAETERRAREIAHRGWPNAAIGSYALDLRLPRQFEEAAELVTEDKIADRILCSPDPDQHVAAVKEFCDVGFDTVFVHQVGQDQEGFMSFYRREVLPAFDRVCAGIGG